MGHPSDPTLNGDESSRHREVARRRAGNATVTVTPWRHAPIGEMGLNSFSCIRARSRLANGPRNSFQMENLMSHFCVLVIGENIEEHLAPYQENNMGDCPEEFMEFIDEEDEYLEKYNTEGSERVSMPDGRLLLPWDEVFRVKGSFGHGSNTHKVPDHLKEISIPFKTLYSTFEEFMAEYHGARERDPKKNRYGYWENPNKKWDWWEEGGRYKNRILTLDGIRCNSAKVSEIDFLKMRAENLKDAISTWDEAQAEKKDTVWNYMMYGISADETKESYLKKHDVCFSAYAVLKDGKWFEKGEMGWFGISTNEVSGEEWLVKLNELLADLPPDTRLTFVDCHI